MLEAQQLLESTVKDETFDERTAIIDSWLTKTGGYAKDMTLRDRIAIAAMPIAANGLSTAVDRYELRIASAAYKIADAMLERRHAAQ